MGFCSPWPTSGDSGAGFGVTSRARDRAREVRFGRFGEGSKQLRQLGF